MLSAAVHGRVSANPDLGSDVREFDALVFLKVSLSLHHLVTHAGNVIDKLVDRLADSQE